MEATQQLVMRAAMAHAQIDDLIALRRRERLHAVFDLTIRIVAGRIEQRGRHFYFKRTVFNQIDQRCRLQRHALHQLSGGMLQLLARLDLIFIGVGVFHQRGRDARGAQKLLRGLCA